MKTLYIKVLFITAFFLSAQAQFTKLYDFTGGSGGYNPQGTLFYDGTFLYGMTSGEYAGYGTIYKIKPDGTGYAKIFDFTGSNAPNPHGSLISDGTYLYGMSRTDGENILGQPANWGFIFKIKPDGTGFYELHDFDSISGGNPFGSLFYDGAFLYGMTHNGGTHDAGVIFKIKPDGTGFSKLLDFDGHYGSNGGYPAGSLISDGTFFYGMTSWGGSHDEGTIFKIKPDGTGYSRLFEFDGYQWASGAPNNGGCPFGDLLLEGGFLYGMTAYGGMGNHGVIFKIKPDGTGYSKLYEFPGYTGGANPWGSLAFNGTFLYGVTKSGGISGLGALFHIKPDGTDYFMLYGFSSGVPDYGINPIGSIITDGTVLYGTTSGGGSNNNGMVFKFGPQLISGAIRTESGSPVPGVTVSLTGTDTLTTTTGSDGRYSFKVPKGGTYTVTPSKNNDIVTNNGITSIDVLLTRRHILGIPLNSPYKIIAADVALNLPFSISITDILSIQSMVLQTITTFPYLGLWTFIPSDYIFADPLNPFFYQRSRTYTNIQSDATNQDFIGIKLGDVNNSWDPNIH